MYLLILIHHLRLVSDLGRLILSLVVCCYLYLKIKIVCFVYYFIRLWIFCFFCSSIVKIYVHSINMATILHFASLHLSISNDFVILSYILSFSIVFAHTSISSSNVYCNLIEYHLILMYIYLISLLCIIFLLFCLFGDRDSYLFFGSFRNLFVFRDHI